MPVLPFFFLTTETNYAENASQKCIVYRKVYAIINIHDADKLLSEKKNGAYIDNHITHNPARHLQSSWRQNNIINYEY